MPIVFVHGLFPAIYDPPPGWLCPDLPGYGDRAAEDASLPAAVDFIRSLCTGPVHIVGHSIGGAIAVLLDAQYPYCVRLGNQRGGELYIERCVLVSEVGKDE